MIPKYNVEYGMELKKRVQPFHYQTDDPVECEEFLAEALEKRFRILSIHHEGIPLNKHEFDRLLKTAGNMLAARRLCASLGITAEEEHYRFGFGV